MKWYNSTKGGVMMKSKILAIENLPNHKPFLKVVDVKPTSQLIFVALLGLIIGVINNDFIFISVALIAISVICLIAFPNRRLVAVTEEYLVLYNQKNRNYCFLVYWDEILFWSYHKHSEKDEIVVELIDHHVEKVDCYSYHAIAPWINMFIAGKEIKKGKHI